MGSFGGHALPGSFFIVFAFHWLVQIYRRYYKSLENGEQFRSSVTFPCDYICRCAKLKSLEWEGILKVFFTTVGFSLEIITAFHDGHFAYLGNGQHATMFFFFFMSGVVDILVSNRPHALPKGIEYIIGMLAFTVEALLFAFHTHGQSSLEQLLHKLLLYVVVATVFIGLLEMKHRSSLLLPLMRANATLLQGIWFWAVAFILYNPVKWARPWDQESHESLMLATMIFAWCLAATFIATIGIGLMVRVFSCCHGKVRPAPTRQGYGLLKNENTRVDLNRNHQEHVDSEDETVFDKKVIISET